MSTLDRDLRNLSRAGFSLWIDERRRFVIVEGVHLPHGYDRPKIPVLIELPSVYPSLAPGVGKDRIYIPGDIRYLGYCLRDVHTGAIPRYHTPGWNGWAWLCYEQIAWNPLRDDMIAFIEMVRASLTDPETL
ncbi:E2/UBC family protein [Bythopirellula polymerisocia]|uniref:Uncharacterized protein n=1 Tax=Bythopirellula polymerisocia TaxID=2528003 RepID=A0A5C6C9C2_9BACT|nr:E2/UBC family protein [Bythopirellula polymerisocia]TWU21313.1 hypothetical protein Pla144_47230 [Bythopirellula polymerisocia]